MVRMKMREECVKTFATVYAKDYSLWLRLYMYVLTIGSNAFVHFPASFLEIRNVANFSKFNRQLCD